MTNEKYNSGKTAPRAQNNRNGSFIHFAFANISVPSTAEMELRENAIPS